MCGFFQDDTVHKARGRYWMGWWIWHLKPIGDCGTMLDGTTMLTTIIKTLMDEKRIGIEQKKSWLHDGWKELQPIRTERSVQRLGPKVLVYRQLFISICFTTNAQIIYTIPVNIMAARTFKGFKWKLSDCRFEPLLRSWVYFYFFFFSRESAILFVESCSINSLAAWHCRLSFTTVQSVPSLFSVSAEVL